jgi:hypothetical protein
MWSYLHQAVFSFTYGSFDKDISGLEDSTDLHSSDVYQVGEYDMRWSAGRMKLGTIDRQANAKIPGNHGKLMAFYSSCCQSVLFCKKLH